MNRNEISLDPHHLRVTSGASKTISELWYVRWKPCTYLAIRLALSPNELNQAFTWALSLRSTAGFVPNDFWANGMFGANCASILHCHLHCLQMDRNDIPQDPRHLGVPSCAYKTISEPLVRLAQTVPLSCIKISTISKRIESSFHLSLVT
jgi:hypothetical protein